MPDSILVTYATKYGSTREVAQQVAATLREKGLEVSVQPARQVADCLVRVFGGVVLLGVRRPAASHAGARGTPDRPLCPWADPR